MAGLFINFSNLHTNKWQEDRLLAAKEMVNGGEIINVAFPVVSPYATKEEVYEMALSSVEKIMSYNPSVVFCQGDFTLCFEIVNRLKAEKIKVVAACNERVISETNEGKIAGFKFVQFREF